MMRLSLRPLEREAFDLVMAALVTTAYSRDGALPASSRIHLGSVADMSRRRTLEKPTTPRFSCTMGFTLNLVKWWKLTCERWRGKVREGDGSWNWGWWRAAFPPSGCVRK